LNRPKRNFLLEYLRSIKVTRPPTLLPRPESHAAPVGHRKEIARKADPKKRGKLVKASDRPRAARAQARRSK
jgi:hypothetical protein